MIWEQTAGRSLSVQVEALVQADARAKPGARLPVADWAVEATCTPSRRAPFRSRLAGTVRDRPETCQLTDRIALSDREVLKNARRAVLVGCPVIGPVVTGAPVW
jgi:hypothetical protein